ncbi:hypothetical protein I2I11_07630 [Pontibacter sp. 172403-2]|uniref:hypothetical protein n=1 Tax=Pontibacter rufus TaxID=2791028 RepID=UPI0018AFF4A2|nr:hypothetical protein [Pontibacter sp. 172403-2]MBF9253159.1 hypothetical protein [Pontibacter sp. 172403-2]
MSELNNPLFENQREFLERQKEEYKNALMGDVDQIKTQGQEIGKKVAMAGGVLLAGYLLKRLFSGGDKKKTKKLKPASRKSKKNTAKRPATRPVTASTHEYDLSTHDYNMLVHDRPENSYTSSSETSERTPRADNSRHSSKALSKGFLKSDLAQVISQQVMALLMIYITKKVDEYVNSISENNDIAAAPVEVIEIETTEIIVPEENAL